MRTLRWQKIWPLFFVTLAYAPAFFFTFAHHDQYRYFRTPTVEKINCNENTQFIGLAFDLGRPVTAILDCWQFKTAHTLGHLSWHRAITLLLILGFAYVLNLVFERRWKFSAQSSGLLAAVICVLPGLLNQFVMSNQAVFLAHIGATVAFLRVDLRPRRLIETFLIFTIALFTYQPAAFLLVALAFADYLFVKKPRREDLRRLVAINLIAFVASIIYYAAMKLILHPYVNYSTRYAEGEGWGGATYAFNLSFDLLGRLKFLGRAMNAVLNFWNIYPSIIITTSLIVFVGFLWVRRPSLKVAVAIVGLFASFAPLLAAHINVILYRSLFVITAYTLIVLIWVVGENFKVNSVIKSTLALGALVLASFNLAMTARNSSLEINFLKSQILERRLLDAKILLFKNVHLGASTRGINGLPVVGDEFNVNSTVFFEDEVVWILRTALIEAGASDDIRLVTCADSEDCTKAEVALRNRPNVYIVSRRADFSGYPLQFPIIDMEPYSR